MPVLALRSGRRSGEQQIKKALRDKPGKTSAGWSPIMLSRAPREHH
jgi:hypothetical protein